MITTEHRHLRSTLTPEGLPRAYEACGAVETVDCPVCGCPIRQCRHCGCQRSYRLPHEGCQHPTCLCHMAPYNEL